jgi:hypothetical protein
MPFGLGKKDSVPFTTDITDKDELEEIQKIAQRLDPSEKVIIVARQSRLKPGGSKMSPDTIFVTDRRVIIRNPSALGMRESVESITYDKITALELEKGMMSSTIKLRASGYQGDIDAIAKDKAEEVAQYVRDAMDRSKKAQTAAPSPAQLGAHQLSVADELAKIAKLKEQGILSDAEFLQMKQELLKRL